jgi:hypothetical protein
MKSVTCSRTLPCIAVILLIGCLAFTQSQSQPGPHDVPVMDGQAGPCSVAFTVTDVNGAPVYDAKVRVHIEYGFAGARRLDLEAATNIDGKTQFKGLPKKVKRSVLYFHASQGQREGSATYDPEKSCSGESDSIVLTENKP